LASNQSRESGRKTPTDVAALVPGLWVEDVALASWEAESGYADPVATTNALATRAREEGATIVSDTRVEAIRVEGGRVRGVMTSAGRSTCRSWRIAPVSGRPGCSPRSG
jgi:glycine/D-amino acid oxidase-like deaminating enzyme